ncbi:MAG: hypothetical protein WC359_13675 [Dehalococcoidia bacterium]
MARKANTKTATEDSPEVEAAATEDSPVFFRCEVCGKIAEGAPLKKCPVCSSGKDRFKPI